MKFWKFVLGGLTLEAARKVRKTDTTYPTVLKIVGIVIVLIIVYIMIYG